MRLRVPNQYTGWYGSVEFKDGVSVGIVSPRQANHLRGAIGGTEILEDDGETVDVALNSNFELLPLGYYLEAGIEPPSKYLTDWQGKYPGQPEAPALVAGVVGLPESPPEIQAQFKPMFTREELEKIVDAKGIKGLREIAPEGVTARSADALIEALLALNVPAQE